MVKKHRILLKLSSGNQNKDGRTYGNRTDVRQTDAQINSQRGIILPRHYRVAGYKTSQIGTPQKTVFPRDCSCTSLRFMHVLGKIIPIFFVTKTFGMQFPIFFCFLDHANAHICICFQLLCIEFLQQFVRIGMWKSELALFPKGKLMNRSTIGLDKSG